MQFHSNRSSWIAGLTIAVAGVGMVAGQARAANLITNPTLTFDSNAIDPPHKSSGQTYDEDVSLNATGSTAQATLEDQTDFGAIQSFEGFTSNAQSGGAVGIFDFVTDTQHPDVRLSLSGDYNGGAGKGNSDWTHGTSPTKYYALFGDDNYVDTTTLILTIDFGTYNSGTTSFTTGAAVRAAGFALANVVTGNTFDVKFLDKLGNVLSDQTADGAGVDASPDSGVYFGYDTGAGATASTGISSIILSFTQTAPSTHYQVGLDDLGFTSALAVPEPATLALFGLGGLVMLGRKRRRA